jgi:hypothetical protein
MLAAARDEAGPLLGGEAETKLLRSLLDGIQSSGAALVLRGDPGTGKRNAPVSGRPGRSAEWQPMKDEASCMKKGWGGRWTWSRDRRRLTLDMSGGGR